MPTLSIKSLIEPATHAKWWTDWLFILLGSTILAAGFVFFINPYDLVPGGIYGLSIVLHNIFPSLQIGTISYAFEIPLDILALCFLGGKLSTRTIITALVTPLIMNGISLLAYPDAASLQALDPSKIAGAYLDLHQHIMLAAIIGGACIGLGAGMVARHHAVGGGTDIAAMFMQKYLHIPFSRSLLIVDGAVVLFGLLVIGFGIGTGDDGNPQKCYLSLYSLIAIFVNTRVLAVVINGFKDNKIIFIIGSHKMEELRHYIVDQLERSATCIKSSGLYTGKEKDMLMLVVTNKEVSRFKKIIKLMAPEAFIVITDAYNIYGEGFQDLPEPGELLPE